MSQLETRSVRVRSTIETDRDRERGRCVDCEQIYVNVREPRTLTYSTEVTDSSDVLQAYVRALLFGLNFKTGEEETAAHNLRHAIFTTVLSLVGQGQLVDRYVRLELLYLESTFEANPNPKWGRKGSIDSLADLLQESGPMY